MQAELIGFGVIEVEGQRYEHDVVIEAGRIRKRDKKPSKKLFKADFGHTPLSAAEDIPWEGGRLIIGTGYSGQLPIMEGVYAEAERRGVHIEALPTRDACALLADIDASDTYAILHVTC
jgi:hypothetical protein